MKKIREWNNLLVPQNAKAPASHKRCIQGQKHLKLINHYTNVCVWWFSSSCQHGQAASSLHRHSSTSGPPAWTQGSVLHSSAIRHFMCNVPRYCLGYSPRAPPQLLLHDCPAWKSHPRILVRRENLLNTQEAGCAPAQNVLQLVQDTAGA